MLDVAYQAVDLTLEGETASLQQVRRQLASKIKSYILRTQRDATIINNIQGDYMNTSIQLGNVSVNGDFNMVTAKNIENSFNKAAGADVSEELKKNLKLLTSLVADLAKRLPEGEAEALSNDLATLTSEAVSKKPRKAWYELAAQGILKVAKTVAELSGPVGAAISAVLKLIG